jgi:phage FluMu protein Com
MYSIRCPHCDWILTAQDSGSGKCPQCQSLLDEPYENNSASEPDSADSIHSSYDPEIAAVLRWGTVRTALALVGAGSILLLIGALLILFASASADLRGGPAVNPGGAFGILGVAVVAGLVLVLTGICMCCVAPGSSGAPLWAVGVVATIAIVAILIPVQIDAQAQAQMRNVRPRLKMDRRGVPREQPQELPEGDTMIRILGYTLPLGIILATAFFTCFLGSVARYFGNRPLATGLIVFLIASVLVQTGAATLFLIDPFDRGPNRYVTWGFVGLFVIVIVWFCVLVFLVRRTIVNALEQRVY